MEQDSSISKIQKLYNQDYSQKFKEAYENQPELYNTLYSSLQEANYLIKDSKALGFAGKISLIGFLAASINIEVITHESQNALGAILIGIFSKGVCDLIGTRKKYDALHIGEKALNHYIAKTNDNLI